jgi:hypothetical protein
MVATMADPIIVRRVAIAQPDGSAVYGVEIRAGGAQTGGLSERRAKRLACDLVLALRDAGLAAEIGDVVQTTATDAAAE